MEFKVTANSTASSYVINFLLTLFGVFSAQEWAAFFGILFGFITMYGSYKHRQFIKKIEQEKLKILKKQSEYKAP